MHGAAVLMVAGAVAFGPYSPPLGALFAVNRADGVLQWNFTTGHGGVSTPALNAKDSALYFQSADTHLYAVSTDDGALLWKVCTGGGASPALSLDSKTAYVGSINGTVWAVNTADGTLLWTFQAASFIYKTPSVITVHSMLNVRLHRVLLYRVLNN